MAQSLFSKSWLYVYLKYDSALAVDLCCCTMLTYKVG